VVERYVAGKHGARRLVGAIDHAMVGTWLMADVALGGALHIELHLHDATVSGAIGETTAGRDGIVAWIQRKMAADCASALASEKELLAEVSKLRNPAPELALIGDALTSPPPASARRPDWISGLAKDYLDAAREEQEAYKRHWATPPDMGREAFEP